MPNLYHPEWDEQVGSCGKHGIPMTPCPQCLAEKDPDIQVVLTAADRTQLDWDLSFKISSMFPTEQAWLAERVI
ncbi:MAG: hypothetical protein V4606_02975 [Patescibacteria group bacterium]